MAITAMPAFNAKSFEELRLEDMTNKPANARAQQCQAQKSSSSSSSLSLMGGGSSGLSFGQNNFGNTTSFGSGSSTNGFNTTTGGLNMGFGGSSGSSLGNFGHTAFGQQASSSLGGGFGSLGSSSSSTGIGFGNTGAFGNTTNNFGSNALSKPSTGFSFGGGGASGTNTGGFNFGGGASSGGGFGSTTTGTGFGVGGGGSSLGGFGGFGNNKPASGFTFGGSNATPAFGANPVSGFSFGSGGSSASTGGGGGFGLGSMGSSAGGFGSTGNNGFTFGSSGNTGGFGSGGGSGFSFGKPAGPTGSGFTFGSGGGSGSALGGGFNSGFGSSNNLGFGNLNTANNQKQYIATVDDNPYQINLSLATYPSTRSDSYKSTTSSMNPVVPRSSSKQSPTSRYRRMRFKPAADLSFVKHSPGHYRLSRGRWPNQSTDEAGEDDSMANVNDSQLFDPSMLASRRNLKTLGGGKLKAPPQVALPTPLNGPNARKVQQVITNGPTSPPTTSRRLDFSLEKEPPIELKDEPNQNAQRNGNTRTVGYQQNEPDNFQYSLEDLDDVELCDPIVDLATDGNDNRKHEFAREDDVTHVDVDLRENNPPILTDASYLIFPFSVSELAQETDETLKAIPSFEVRNEHGGIKWLGITDVRGLDLDKIVVIRKFVAEAYPVGTTKPKAGTGLNRPAEISLFGIWPGGVAKRSPKNRKKWLNVCAKRLQAGNQTVDVKSWNSVDGTLTFSVEHF